MLYPLSYGGSTGKRPGYRRCATVREMPSPDRRPRLGRREAWSRHMVHDGRRRTGQGSKIGAA